MIRQLDHYNIRTGKIDETVAFYTGVLGLRDGPFPGDRKFGAWLYDTTDRPVLHLRTGTRRHLAALSWHRQAVTGA